MTHLFVFFLIPTVQRSRVFSFLFFGNAPSLIFPLFFAERHGSLQPSHKGSCCCQILANDGLNKLQLQQQQQQQKT